ncbi:MAG: type VII secretion protein EccCa, partial [Actinomyces sp.]
MARLARKKQEPEPVEENIPTRPQGELALEPPPDREEPPNASNLLTSVVPMLGSVGMMAFMALSQSNNPRMLFMAGAMVFAMVAMVGTQMYRQVSAYRTKVADMRGEYLAYLADTRRLVRDLAKQHYQYLQYTLPEPDSLVLLAESGARVWERRTKNVGLLNVRLGLAQQKLSKTLKAPELGVLANPDVVCQSAVARFVDVQSNLGLAPFATYLDQFLTVELCGPRALTEAQLRAMIVHLAVMVPPADLRIAVLAGEETIGMWDWVKWLPHCRSEDVEDAVGPARMVSTSAEELDELMGPGVETRGEFRQETAGHGPRPHILLVVDGAEYPSNWIPMSEKGMESLTRVVIRTAWEDLEDPSTLRLILRRGKGDKMVDGKRTVEVMPLGQVVQQDVAPAMYRPDQMGIAEATAVARRLTRFTEGMAQAITNKSEKKASSDLMDLLGLGDVRLFDPDKRWRHRKGREYLRVPFGLTESGNPIIIDIKESAKNGMGPHGMLIGATGSGKSEVLRTMVLAMALTHDPIQLNFVLVDFKGGATFAGMDTLPHVSAMISNLEEESFLVARMEEALQGEMSRRQELLRAAGNFAKVEEYENARRAGKHDGPPLPALFVIIDEFSELLVAHADFIKVFEAIGRLGRSLSVHLLFASQRIDTKAGDLMS